MKQCNAHLSVKYRWVKVAVTKQKSLLLQPKTNHSVLTELIYIDTNKTVVIGLGQFSGYWSRPVNNVLQIPGSD